VFFKVVAANIVTTPDQYRWSSYAWHAWGEPDSLITDHILYEALYHDSYTRQQVYRKLFKHQIPEINIHQIRKSLTYSYPLGNDRFRAQIEKY